VVTVKLLAGTRLRDTRQVPLHDLSLSEEVEEAYCVGDRGTLKDAKALGLLVLEKGEASGLPHDLHHQQRRQGAVGELNLRSVEAFLRSSSVV